MSKVLAKSQVVQHNKGDPAEAFRHRTLDCEKLILFPNSKSHWLLVVLALLALRVVIGWHFYTEGVSKLKSGNFSAEPFLRSANGPAADLFHRCVADYDGRLRLGLVITRSESGETTWILDPLVTEELWKGFVYRAARQLQFGDPKLIEALARSSKDLKQRLTNAEAKRESTETIDMLRRALKKTSVELEVVRKQKDVALAIAQKYIDEYRAFLAENEAEILAYFRGAQRFEGFERDGHYKAAVVQGVRSLRSQNDQIVADRTRDARPWLTEVDAMWNGVEADINELAIEPQRRSWVKLDQPHKSLWSPLPWIDRIVPWFDTIIGACLILGLFTRTASLAGAGFLLGIIATQPPLFAGSAPTISQSIELIGLLVLFATRAGRFAGLDVFLPSGIARRRRWAALQEPTL